MSESNIESTSESDQWTPDWRNRQAMEYLNAYNERFPLREGETAPQRFIRARAAGGIRYPAWEKDSIIKARFRHLAGTAIPDSEWTAAFDLGEGLIRTNPDTLDAGVIKGWLLAGLTDEEIAARHPLTPFQIRVFHNTWFDVRSHSLLPHDLLRITCGEPPETETSNWENRERRVLWIALSCGRSTLDEILNPPSILVRDSITFERLEWEGGKRLRYKTRLYPNGGRMVGTHPREIRLRRPVQDDSPVASSVSCTEVPIRQIVPDRGVQGQTASPIDPDSAVPAERQEVESRLQAAGNRERTVLKRKSPKAASKGTSKVKMQKGY